MAAYTNGEMVAKTKGKGKSYDETLTLPWEKDTALTLQVESLGLFEDVRVLAEASIGPEEVETKHSFREFQCTEGSFVVSWELISGEGHW